MDKERIKKRPYGQAHQRIMICCYLQKKKKEREEEGGKVTSALSGPARRKQLGQMAQISELRGGAPCYPLQRRAVFPVSSVQEEAACL